VERDTDLPDHDLGDESNPDVGIAPGHGKDVAGDEAQWATVGRIRSDGDDADATGDDLDAA
jgi:hypothetical protein